MEKVTVFITRRQKREEQFLLFRHPFAGVQIPAGTVEAGESPAEAALREGREESGLQDLVVEQYLGEEKEPLADGEARIATRTLVYARPDHGSFAWTTLPRGTHVRLLGRAANGFIHIRFEEPERLPDSQYITMAITAWAPASAVTRDIGRHFFRLRFHGETAGSWPVRTDNHTFTAFWSPLAPLPEIVAPQRHWLDKLLPPAAPA